MAETNRKVLVSVEEDGKRTVTEHNVPKDSTKVVIVINNQITFAPNTTQLASGAGHNSAAGSNASLDSSNTEQQHSVGADGKARNVGMKGKQIEPHASHSQDDEDAFVVVLNNQQNLGSEQSSATQVASGGGMDSAGGTNAAIESSNTKQQQAVGGGGRAVNKGMKNKQVEKERANHSSPNVIWPGWKNHD